ncbi:unnamed protein product [marine sediment metagenome]|uniref:Uncharacterized protein n=1 Tax=marine sediment metagenome TaxID=412755 RepID=X1KII3_9ZZZZ
MNLKFQEVNWDNNGLMYVAFNNNGETLRWYPKWDDVRRLVQSAVITEGYPDYWQSPELDKFKNTFHDLIELIDFYRSIHAASCCPG